MVLLRYVIQYINFGLLILFSILKPFVSEDYVAYLLFENSMSKFHTEPLLDKRK